METKKGPTIAAASWTTEVECKCGAQYTLKESDLYLRYEGGDSAKRNTPVFARCTFCGKLMYLKLKQVPATVLFAVTTRCKKISG